MKYRLILSGIIAIPVIAIPFLLIISGNTSQPTFWNYEQHINPIEEKNLRNSIGYNTFGDLDELEAAIYSNKVMAAISSDYQAASLAKKAVIQKIQFDKIWDGFDTVNLKQSLQAIYSDLTFQALDQAYDLGDKGKLWEYVIPYVIQEKVVAFDSRGHDWTDQEQEKLKTSAGIEELFPDRSYRGILNTLKTKGYNHLLINDYIRDNMMIGSEISSTGFNSLPTFNTYQEYIDNFKTTIETGFGQLVTSNNVVFKTDGTSILQDLIDPSKNWDTALMYNGDALDAYEATDHFPALNDETNFVRVVFPNNPVYLIDTLIIPSYIQDDLLVQTYQSIKNYLFNNGNASISQLEGLDLHHPLDAFPLLINFNFVAYSFPYQAYDSIIKTSYFEYDKQWKIDIAKYIYSITPPPTSQDYQKYFIQQVSDDLFTSMFYYYIMMKN